MKVLKYPLGQMQANCYFLLDGSDCLIIDPGDSADFILEQIARQNLNLIGILATHGHFDHTMAVGELQLSLPVPLYIHPDDNFLLKRVEKTAAHFLEYEPAAIAPQIVRPMKIGKNLLEGFTFDVIHTPGHTPGSVCLYFKDDGMIFTGDTLFQQAVGRYDAAYSDKKTLQKSLKNLFELPEETEVYSGHGEDTTIGFEKKYPVI